MSGGDRTLSLDITRRSPDAPSRRAPRNSGAAVSRYERPRRGDWALFGALTARAWCLPPGSVARRAGDLLRACLRRHVTDEELTSDLVAVVDELAANAWRHARGPCEMRGVTAVSLADCGQWRDCTEVASRPYSRTRPFRAAQAACSAGAVGLSNRATDVDARAGQCDLQFSRRCALRRCRRTFRP